MSTLILPPALRRNLVPATAPPRPILEREFLLGVDVDTREEVRASLSLFLTSYWCCGEIGIGKSNHVLAPLYEALKAPLPGAVFDGAGTLATNLLHAVACIATRRMAYADILPEALGQAQRFLLRHPIITFGDPSRAISIDLLRRQLLPNGDLETLEHVATRTYQVFNRLFADDADKRVRFRRVAMMVLTILSAAGRPIREYKRLISPPERTKHGPVANPFLEFCLREAQRLGIQPSQQSFFDDQVQAFEELRRLPLAQFLQATDSTDNALNYFYTSPGADYVNEQSLDLPRLLGSGGKLLLTHTLPDLTLATMLFRAYDSILRTWVRGREPLRRRTAYGFQVIDEPFWIDQGVSGDWAVQRNKRWSVLLLHQRERQLDDIQDGLSDLMASYAKLRGRFRPDTVEVATEIAYRLRTFRPDGLQIPYRTRTTSETKGLSESLGESWGETLSESRSTGESEQHGQSDGWSDSAGDAQTSVPDDPANLPSWTDSRGRGRSGSATSSNGSSWQDTSGTAKSTGGSTGSSTAKTNGEAWTEQLHFVPVAEQALDAAQGVLRTPDFQLFLTYGEKTRQIALAKQREYPVSLFGVPVAEHARTYQQKVYRSWTLPRAPFDTAVTVDVTPTVVPAPAPSSAPASPSAAAPVEERPNVSGAPVPTATTPVTIVEDSVPATQSATVSVAPTEMAPTQSVETTSPSFDSDEVAAETSPDSTGSDEAIPPAARSPFGEVLGTDGKRRVLSERDVAILQAAASWHFVALDSLRLDPDRFGGYSGVSDRVKALADGGLLAKMQPPAARGTGSNPIYYLLSRAGANALAATGQDEPALLRVVENTAKTRVAVERHELGQLQHQLAIANLLALASAGAGRLPGGELLLTRFDKEFVLDVAVAPIARHLTAALRKRLYLEDNQAEMRLRPDGVIVVRTVVAGQPVCQPYLLEVETGRKETGFEELAYAHALRSYAARASRVLPDALAHLGVSGVRPFRVLVVAATPALEERLVAGVSAALAAIDPRDRGLYAFSTLPLVNPKVEPTARVERAAALAQKAGTFFGAVWRTADSPERVALLS
ncbi:MAG: hypothetical protein DIJKHBIC_02288 [Thermoanaerobaculia bacterium]|nr:hypothetical protein [Thermoanaerobaculia bacterium]